MMKYIENFIGSFTLIEGLTLFISFIAIIISLFSLYQSSKSERRQIRYNKLEEMIEIITLIMSKYHYFDDLFLLQNKIQYCENRPELNELIEKEKQYITSLKQISQDERLQEKIFRLGILSDCYLPNNELKFRVRSLISLFSCLYERTIYRNVKDTFVTFRTYPRAWTLLPYVEILIKDLNKEMNLGYENLRFGENPHLEKFKEELNIK